MVNVNKDDGLQNHIDILGITIDITGEHQAILAPMNKARAAEFLVRMERLRKVGRAARLSGPRMTRVIQATVGILRWDAPWSEMNDYLIKKLRMAIERAIQGRLRHAAWRRRGGYWIMLDKGHSFEPEGLAFTSLAAAWPASEAPTMKNGQDQEKNWAFRCAIAAEPCPDKLHNLYAGIPQECEHCGEGTRADTMHIMWDCPHYEEERHNCRQAVLKIAEILQGAERTAWLQNGWIKQLRASETEEPEE